ncbi:MAG: hypothetical protein ACODAB_01585 [Gemmatimonadota bacterium]
MSVARGCTVIAGALCAMLTPTSLAAQEPARDADVFEALVGEWRGEGSLMGRDAQFSMRWESGDGFAVLTFANAFVDADSQVVPVLNSVAVYRTSRANPEAVWLDSRGVRVEIRWEASDSTLVARWTAPTEEGRTTYRVRVDEVEVVDEVSTDEGWRTFGTARYTRAPPSTR